MLMQSNVWQIGALRVGRGSLHRRGGASERNGKNERDDDETDDRPDAGDRVAADGRRNNVRKRTET